MVRTRIEKSLSHNISHRRPPLGARVLLVALSTMLPGCFISWDRVDSAELTASILDSYDIPVLTVGPQVFATSDGECYYAYKMEVRNLRDDAVVARCRSVEFMRITRAAWANDCTFLCTLVDLRQDGGSPVRGFSRALVRIDDEVAVERAIRTDLPIVDLATAPQAKRAVVALATAEDEEQVYSVIASLDAQDGHEYVRQSWEVRHLRGLDCTPDGETFVFAGYVDGVQGVYAGRASVHSVPELLARDGQNPSISADGTAVAMTPCIPPFTLFSEHARELSRVRIRNLNEGTTQEVDLGDHVVVCGTRYVENPRRLLVTGMRAEGDEVWWVIWRIDGDGVATELRTWQCGQGLAVEL